MKKKLALALCCVLGMGILTLSPRPAAAQCTTVQVDLADEHMYIGDGDRLYIPASAVKIYSDGSIAAGSAVTWAGTIYTTDRPNNITGRVPLWDGDVDPGEELLLTYSVIYRRGPNYDPGLAVVDEFDQEFIAAYPWNTLLDIQTAGLQVDGQGILNAVAQANGWDGDTYLGSFNIVLTRDGAGTLRSYIGVLPGQSRFLGTRLLIYPGYDNNIQDFYQLYPGVDVNGVRVGAYQEF